MKMYKQIGEFIPDSLIVSGDFPILKEGIGLKAGYGVLKRGSLILRGSDKAGYISGTKVLITEGEGESAKESDMEMAVFGILTDDIDTGNDKSADNIPATVYQSGEFNRKAVIVSGDAAVNDYEDELKKINIYLRNVQEY